SLPQDYTLSRIKVSCTRRMDTLHVGDPVGQSRDARGATCAFRDRDINSLENRDGNMRPVHRRAPPRAAGRRRTRGVPLLAVLFAAASPCLADEPQPIAEVEVVAVVPRSFPPEYVTNAQGRPGG